MDCSCRMTLDTGRSFFFTRSRQGRQDRVPFRTSCTAEIRDIRATKRQRLQASVWSAIAGVRDTTLRSYLGHLNDLIQNRRMWHHQELFDECGEAFLHCAAFTTARSRDRCVRPACTSMQKRQITMKTGESAVIGRNSLLVTVCCVSLVVCSFGGVVCCVLFVDVVSDTS